VVADISAYAGQEMVLGFGVVDLDWFNNWVDDTTDRLTIDNIRIDQAAPVPEPSTFLLMVIGLAGLGLKSYRRKNVN
jgi:hypothetical protein